MPNYLVAWIIVWILIFIFLWWPTQKQSAVIYIIDNRPRSSATEAFSPYPSILANDTYRSDPSFDIPLSKQDDPPTGNYNDLFQHH